MKILQIASGDFFTNYGGGQVYVKNIVKELSSRDHLQISVISFTKTDKAERKKFGSAEIISISDQSSFNVEEEIVAELKPDIIHVHAREEEFSRIGQDLNIPVVVTCHHGGLLCPAGARMDYNDYICTKGITHENCLPCVLKNTRTGLKLWYPFMRFVPEQSYLKFGKFLKSKRFIPFITPVGIAACQIQRMSEYWNEAAEKCTLMIAPCNAIGETMIKNGLDKNKFRVIPHGIPLPEFRPQYPRIENGRLTFYYVGRICYVKGIHVLLKAFHEINNNDMELHLIGGTGNKSEQRYMSNLQRQYKSDKRIIWHGKVSPDQIFVITKDFHVSISPSICMEIYGLNIAEALALGKPVIATRCGGGEMQIEDGRNGWLVEPNNEDALKEKIVFAIENKDLLPEMSKNCSAISIQEHCDKLIELYSDLISR